MQPLKKSWNILIRLPTKYQPICLQILLKQSATSVDKLQEVFKLTDEEKYLLLESGVGEGIFFAGLKHVAVKTIASYTEDQIITSDPSQILAIKKAKDELDASGSK